MSLLRFILMLTTLGCVEVTPNNGDNNHFVTVALDPNTFAEDNSDEIFTQIQGFFNASSRRLLEATRGSICMESILLVVPSHWTSIEDRAHVIYQDTDIRLFNVSSVGNGDHSFLTVQPQRCGQRGEYMIATSTAFQNVSTPDLIDSFVREWARLHYGVFPETGLGDDRFPSVYYTANGCSLTGCTDSTNYSSENPVSSHPTTHSSLMDRNVKATTFCDADTHNVIAPTPQNALCDEKSTWEVIIDSEEFKNNQRPNGECKQPQLSMLRAANVSAVFVLDPSVLYNPFQNVLLKLIHFLSNDGIQVGLTSMKGSSTLNLTPFTKSNQNIFKRKLKEFKNSVSQDIPLEAVINSGVQMLDSNSGFLIVITREELDVDASHMKRILENVSRIHVISIGKRNHSFVKLENRKRLSWFHLGTENVLSLRSSLFTILMTLFSFHQPLFSSQWTQISLMSSNENIVSDDVIINETNLQQLEMWVDCDQLFEAPTKWTLNGTDIEFDFDSLLQAYYPLNPPEKSFDYNFTVFLDESKSMIASVWLKEPTPTLSVEILIDQFSDEINKNLTVFRAVVKSFSQGIDHIEVFVNVTTPDSNIVTVKLLDNGNGDPDNLQGDDVYSRYFTDFSEQPGVYEVLGRIYFKYKGTDRKLFVMGQSFYSEGQKRSFAPSNIRDFHLKSIDKQRRNLTIGWTAPGQHLDSGKVSWYELRCDPNRTLLKSNSALDLIVRFEATQSAGEKQFYSIDFDFQITHCAIRAFNDNGSHNAISNIVAIYKATAAHPSSSTQTLFTDDSTDQTTEMTDSSPTTTSGPNTTAKTEGMKIETLSLTDIVIICGCVLGFITLVIAITICFVFHQKAKLTKAMSQQSSANPWNTPPNNLDIIRGYALDDQIPTEYGGPQPQGPWTSRSPDAVRNNIPQSRYPPNIVVTQASNHYVPNHLGNANEAYDTDSTDSPPLVRGRINIISKV